MPTRSPSIPDHSPNDILNAFNRYLQYDEIPENSNVNVLWRKAYAILLNMAGSRGEYGNYITKLSGKVGPEDIVQEVLYTADKKLKGKYHEPPINFNYRRRIEWAWMDHWRKYKHEFFHESKRDPSDESERDPSDESERNRGKSKRDPSELASDVDMGFAETILEECLGNASECNELGHRVFKLKHLPGKDNKHLLGKDNEEIERQLGQEPKAIALAYFEFFCEVNICMEEKASLYNICMEEKASLYRCWLELLEAKPILFETKAVDAMEYKPKTKGYKILGIKQQTYSKRMIQAKEWIECCMKGAN